MKIYVALLTVLLVSSVFMGCASQMNEVVLSDPPGADIYWGKEAANIEKTEYRTPFSRSIGEQFTRSGWESWCYRLKLAGYHDSDIICRPEEDRYRLLDVRLRPLQTEITSDPPDAEIYWGPSADDLEKTIHRTPRVEKNPKNGVSWKAWYFQVKKEGYRDSKIIFQSQTLEDRKVHFVLELKK